MNDIFSYFLCNSQTNNEAKEEPEKKKRKIVKSKKDKQKVSVAIKIMEKSQPDSKVQIFGLPL
jgi:hypothetical protein